MSLKLSTSKIHLKTHHTLRTQLKFKCKNNNHKPITMRTPFKWKTQTSLKKTQQQNYSRYICTISNFNVHIHVDNITSIKCKIKRGKTFYSFYNKAFQTIYADNLFYNLKQKNILINKSCASETNIEIF